MKPVKASQKKNGPQPTPVAVKPASPPIVKPAVTQAKPVPSEIKPAAPVAKPAPVAVSKPAPAAPPAPASRKPVTIEAKIDVGFGNALYLRGEGNGLNWNHGVPLTCVDGTTWKWSAVAGEKLQFKLLLNDAIWAKGENLVATPGERIEIAPAF